MEQEAEMTENGRSILNILYDARCNQKMDMAFDEIWRRVDMSTRTLDGELSALIGEKFVEQRKSGDFTMTSMAVQLYWM
jgi:hypothetical protein